MGTFQDTDGKGYLLIHHGMIYELSSDYKSAKRLVTSGQKAGESPAMFKSNGLYYWLSSNLTSWERNDNFYLTATALEGPWTHRGFFAPEGTLTWNSQCSFVFSVMGKKDTLFLYTGDRWSFPRQGAAGTYVWQPIVVKEGSMSLPVFQEHWRVDFANATWSPVPLKKKPVKASDPSPRESWEISNGARVSNKKGATITYPFKGRRVGITGISKNTGGYAKVWILDSTGKEVVGTTVDFYSKYEYSSLKFLSPLLEKGAYTLCIEVMGEHGVWTNKAKNIFGSTDDYVTIEEVFLVND